MGIAGKQNEQKKELATALKYAESIISTLREPFLVLNRSLRIVSANRSFCTVFRITEKETVGQLLPDLGNKQWSIPKLLHLLKEILPKKTDVKNYEFEHDFEQIGHRIMRLNACQLRIPKEIARAITEEEEELILLAIEDITERRKAEAAVEEKGRLEAALKRQKEIDKMQSEFISVASHQLRTPLTGIQWVIERFLKKEENLNAKEREYLGDIRFSAQRLSSLVDALLNVSRIEDGRVSISAQSFDVVAFVQRYFAEITPFAAKKNIRLYFEKCPDTLIITTDSSALRNIIQSVISNAVEYSPKGGEIEIELEKVGDHFRFTVKDTGIGIPKKEQATIFDKFTRGSNAKLIKTDGIGLGLYIAKQATDLLGGKIWFESKVNKGTTFYVELPLEVKKKTRKKPLA